MDERYPENQHAAYLFFVDTACAKEAFKKAINLRNVAVIAAYGGGSNIDNNSLVPAGPDQMESMLDVCN